MIAYLRLAWGLLSGSRASVLVSSLAVLFLVVGVAGCREKAGERQREALERRIDLLRTDLNLKIGELRRVRTDSTRLSGRLIVIEDSLDAMFLRSREEIARAEERRRHALRSIDELQTRLNNLAQDARSDTTLYTIEDLYF